MMMGALGAMFATAALAASPDDGYRDVDPFIGTGGGGHTFPGATVPFGMIQLSPDTQIRHFKQSYNWAAGYRYEDTTILGFSHTHFSGAGHSDLGDVLVMPIAGDVRLEPGEIDKPGSGYRSRFSHETEIAQPGYYAVTLADYGVRAELTATPRRACIATHFPTAKPAHVLLDLRSSIYDYPGKVLWSRLRVRAGRHRDRHARDARLGAGPPALLRDALLAADHGSSTATIARRRRRNTRASTPAADGAEDARRSKAAG